LRRSKALHWPVYSVSLCTSLDIISSHYVSYHAANKAIFELRFRVFRRIIAMPDSYSLNYDTMMLH